MKNSVRPRVYFYRAGFELKNHPMNGKEHVGFGVYSGKLGNVTCFRSIVVRTTRDQELSEVDFGGKPVMAKVWSPEGQWQWFAVASPSSVANKLEAKAATPARREAVAA